MSNATRCEPSPVANWSRRVGAHPASITNSALAHTQADLEWSWLHGREHSDAGSGVHTADASCNNGDTWNVSCHPGVQPLPAWSLPCPIVPQAAGGMDKWGTLMTKTRPIMAPRMKPPTTSAVECLLSMMRDTPVNHANMICSTHPGASS